MRKLLTGAMAAISFAGAVAATTAPAQAQGYYRHGGYGYYGGGHYYRHDNTGAAVAAGVVGLALGAAIAGNHGGGYYAPRAYYGPPAYEYGRTCQSDERVWDPYIRRSVIITHRYAC